MNYTKWDEDVSYLRWEATLPWSVLIDDLWYLPEYRLARFAESVAAEDAKILIKDGRTHQLASQLYETVNQLCEKIIQAGQDDSAEKKLWAYREAVEAINCGGKLYYQAHYLLGADIIHERLRLLHKLRMMITDETQTMILRENMQYHIGTFEGQPGQERTGTQYTGFGRQPMPQS